MERIDEYLSITPSVRQKKFQREPFNVFIHYGMTTYTGKEWGDGKVPPSEFNPTALDTDQWAKAIKSSGAYGVILTCKHHDGFCLWPSKTTDYTVANSPYKGGKGDVVKEISDSCRKYGLKFGVYVSPWDRNHKAYSTPEYNNVFKEQLRELLSNYGDIFCVWFDGACGAHMDGKTRQEYDWDTFYALIRELQPDACISNCAPDIRWVGNEGGIARTSEWNVVPAFSCDIQTIQSKSQQSDNQEMKKTADIVADDLGSREFLSRFDSFMWYPAEVDVSIRPGWFYHKEQDGLLRSLDNLLKIYYTSVGGNSLLLLNVPPNRQGLFAERDIARLKELGDHLSKHMRPIEIKSITAPESEIGAEIEGVLDDSIDNATCDPIKYYTPKSEASEYAINVKFDKAEVNRMRIVENCAFSQRIEKFKIYAVIGNKKKLVYDGTTVGYNRIAVFKKPVVTGELELVITECRRKPYIELIQVFQSDGFTLKKRPFDKLIKKIHYLSYKRLIDWDNKQLNKIAEKNKQATK